MQSFNRFDETSTKRVSYILATKNRAKLLEKTLNLARSIKSKDDELIVIDGGSTDNTKQIIKQAKSVVDIFLSEPDVNPTQAFNKGILLSHGRYIKFLCDDDFIYKNGLEQAVEVLESNPEIEVLVCGGIMTNTVLHRKRIIYVAPGSNYGTRIDDPFVLGGNGVGLLIRKSILSKVGLFALDWISDASFLVNCIHQGIKVKFCRIKLFHAYVQSSSITSAHLKDVENDISHLMQKYASKKVYYRYQVNQLFFKHKLINKLLTPVKILIKLIHYSENRLTKTNQENSKKYIWDGGFS